MSYRVGDRVKVMAREESNGHAIGYVGVITKTWEVAEKVQCTLDRSYWNYDHELKLVESVNNTKIVMNLKNKFINLFLTEPERSLRKAGVTNGDGLLTIEGTEIFLNYLLQKNREDFNTSIVQKIVEEDDDR